MSTSDPVLMVQLFCPFQIEIYFGVPPSFGVARTLADPLSRLADLTQSESSAQNSAATLAHYL